MGAIRELLEWIVTVMQRPNDDSPTAPRPVTSPLAIVGDEGTTLPIRLYQSRALTDRHGRAPERAVARYLRDALSPLGYAPRIHFEHAPIPAAGYEDQSLEALQWWSSHAPVIWGKQVLITDARGGGIAYVGGEYALTPGRCIDHDEHPVELGDSRYYSNVRANLHEVGHLLGGRHRDEMLTPPSMCYTESGAAAFTNPRPLLAP